MADWSRSTSGPELSSPEARAAGWPAASTVTGRPTVALLDWSHLIEDIVDHLGISLPALREFRGSWIVGYMDALRVAGVRAVWFSVTGRVAAPVRFTHAPTGATICLLPAPAAYRAIRRRVPNPYATTVEQAAGDLPGARRAVAALLKELAPYTATPVRLLARELRREACEVLLCQEYEHARFDVCVMLGRLMRLPVFATFQGGDWQLSRLERPLRPMTLKACAGLIVGTRREAQRVRARYRVPPEKLARIFNPIDVGSWRPAEQGPARQALGIPAHARVAVWHGRVYLHRKGLDLLLEAWRRLGGSRPGRERRLILLGTGADAAELRQRIAGMQLADVQQVDRFLNEPAAIRRYLAAADVYVLASRHEGFPVAPIEAMGCGLPVVATDVPGMADILEDGEASGGLIVPCEDVPALAAGVGRLLDDQPWARLLGRRARRRVETAFSREAVGQQLRAVLFRRAAGRER